MNRKIGTILLVILLFQLPCHAEISIKPFIDEMYIKKDSEIYNLLEQYRETGYKIVNRTGHLNLTNDEMKQIYQQEQYGAGQQKDESMPEMNPDSTIKYYVTKNDGSYSYQYAKENKFKYLINNDYRLNLPLIKGYSYRYSSAIDFDKNFDIIEERTVAEAYSFENIFENYELIDEKIKQENIKEIYEIKIVKIVKESLRYYYENRFLYLNTDKGEYGICNKYKDEEYALLSMADLLKFLSGKEEITFPHTQMFNINEHYARTEKPIEKQTVLVKEMAEKGLVKGENGDFELYRCPTRLEALVMLLRAKGLEEAALSYESNMIFTDVPTGHWGEKYVNYAYNEGITKGVGNNMFDPDTNINMNHFLTMILRNNGTDTENVDIINLSKKSNLINDIDEERMTNIFNRGDMFQIIYNLVFENQ